jgi:hypothetical protein
MTTGLTFRTRDSNEPMKADQQIRPPTALAPVHADAAYTVELFRSITGMDGCGRSHPQIAHL